MVPCVEGGVGARPAGGMGLAVDRYELSKLCTKDGLLPILTNLKTRYSSMTTNEKTAKGITNRMRESVSQSKEHANRLCREAADRADLAVRRDPWHAMAYAFAAGVVAATTLSLIASAATVLYHRQSTDNS